MTIKKVKFSNNVKIFTYLLTRQECEKKYMMCYKTIKKIEKHTRKKILLDNSPEFELNNEFKETPYSLQFEMEM